MDPAFAALLGVALGGALTLGVEIYRNRSARRQRLDDVRRGAYARLLSLSARTGYEATMVARRTFDEFGRAGAEPPIDPGAWPDGLARQSAQRFSELSDELTLVYEEIRLVASDKVAKAAGLLMGYIGELGVAARSGGGESAVGFADARRRVHDARAELRPAMRRELGSSPDGR
jgi:hypothetical protein